jgi:hypothetical protein
MDENSDTALFSELGSSPATMEAGKALDAYGSQPGHTAEQNDGVQAYTQALMEGIGSKFLVTGGQRVRLASSSDRWFYYESHSMGTPTPGGYGGDIVKLCSRLHNARSGRKDGRPCSFTLN